MASVKLWLSRRLCVFGLHRDPALEGTFLGTVATEGFITLPQPGMASRCLATDMYAIPSFFFYHLFDFVI